MRKIVSLLTVLMLLCTLANGQVSTISGIVVDQNGQAVPFASIKVKGKFSGVSADASGKFIITNIANGATITVSAQGMQEKEIKIGASSSVINVTLIASTSSNLQEVVVTTGLGTARDKRKVAIDVATLNTKDVAKSATASIEQALIGKIAGAQIQQVSGEPGAGASIILRGINTLGTTQPMFLLDGIQIYDLNLLDLSNVDRIEVVKGAAAGMLYGAQGANGVIQIFSKKGSKTAGKPAISFHTKMAFDEVISKKNLLANYHHYDTDASGSILSSVGSGPIVRNAIGEWLEPSLPAVTGSLKNDKPYKEALYDHLDQAYSKAVTRNHSLNISGGTGKFDYSLSLSILNQENVVFNELKRQNMSFNIGTELAKGLTLRMGSQAIFQQEDLLSLGRFNMINSYRWIDFEFKDPNGYYTMRPKDLNEKNPLSELDWHARDSRDFRFIPNFGLNYKINKFIELDYKFGMEIWNTEFNDFVRNQTVYTEPILHDDTFWGPSEKGAVRQDYQRSVFRNSLASIFLKFDFQQDFKINLPIKSLTQASYDWRKDSYKTFFGEGTEFPDFPPFTLGTAAIKNSGGSSSSFVSYGFLVSQSFDYGNIAGISGGFRSDYSSEFGKGGKPFTFPRATIYFRPSEFIASNIVKDWKLRAAYGEAGIQPQRFARQVTLGTSTVGTATAIYLPDVGKNPDLRVQRSKELEIGTDIALLTSANNWFSKVNFSGTYWNRKSDDVIQNADLAVSGGFSGVINNLISLSSNGFEFSLDADILKSKNIEWNFSVRFGKSKTIVDKVSNGKEVVYGGGNQDDIFSLKEGLKLGVFYGQTLLQSLIQTHGTKGTLYIPTANVGDYELVNGIVVKKSTKAASITVADDKSFIGDPNPKFTLSFINNFRIVENLNIDIQVDWWYGHKIYNLTKQWLFRDRLHKDYDKVITVNGDAGAYVAFYNSVYNSVQSVNYFVEDGSFVRLRDVSLSYNFRPLLSKKPSAIQNLTLFVSGRNLVTITDYSGLDPEVSSYRNTGALRGIDNFGFPNLKSFQVGINLGF